MPDVLPLSSLADAASSRWEPLIRRFDRAWRKGARPLLEDYLPADDAGRSTVLRELVHTELEHRLRAGETVRIED